METKILKLINECDELIQVLYSPTQIMDLKDLYAKFDELDILTKEKYPLYNEEFVEAVKRFRKSNKNHYMGHICGVLTVIEKSEKQYVEFVDINRIQELINISTNKFDLTKLIQFCVELNRAYNKQSYLTIPLLLRAIIDHVPPIFEKENFGAVCGGYGNQSFQKSMNHLDKTLRNIADSTIHGQIRNKEILPNKTQINFKADLDVLLAEICRVLK
jgi:hypothetical protein